jgi:hypothetical protein
MTVVAVSNDALRPELVDMLLADDSSDTVTSWTRLIGAAR